MEVILLKDVKGLGIEGASVKTKDGYARNYLIPRSLAMASTPGALEVLKAKKRKKIKELKKTKGKAVELAKTLSKLSLTIRVEAGVDDTIFGSVTPEGIHRALQQENVDIDKKNIILKEPIKKLGVYNAEVKLHPEVKENLRIWIVKK